MKNVAVHPLFVVLFPILAFKATNIGIGSPEEVLVPAALSILIALLIWALSFAGLKQVKPAAIVASSAILWFYSFGAISSVVTPLVKIPDGALLLIYTAVWAAITGLTLHKAKDLDSLTGLLNTVSACLVIYNLALIATRCADVAKLTGPILSANLKQDKGVELKPAGAQRDIYYIILDGCGSPSVMRDYYRYDNSAFVKTLESQGFAVPQKSISNYGETLLSLASSLNMRQITFLQEQFARYNDASILGEMIKDNRVLNLLRRQGYKFVNVSSGVFCSDNPPNAYRNFSANWLNIFNVGILDTSVLPAFPGYLNWLADQIRAQRLCFFNHIDEIKDIPGPKFVFAHIILPHPPFLFSENGESVVRLSSYNVFNPEGYKGQTMFVEKLVEKAMANLTNVAEQQQPIIIIQGDHGPVFTDDKPTTLFCSTRFRILNAYHLPGVDKSVVYDGISPVNTFRLVFDKYFNTSFGLIKDEAFYSPQTALFDLSPATDKIKDRPIADKTAETSSSGKPGK